MLLAESPGKEPASDLAQTRRQFAEAIEREWGPSVRETAAGSPRRKDSARWSRFARPVEFAAPGGYEVREEGGRIGVY